MNTNIITAIMFFCLCSQAQQFPVISRTVANPQHNGPSRSFIKFQNNHFFNTEYETLKEGLPNLHVYDNAGALKYRASIWFPDAARVVINDAAANSDGSSIAVGNALKKDGSVARFIAFVDSKGELNRVVRTDPFIPFHMTIATNGTIWVFGRQLPESDGTGVQFDAVERYSPTGIKTGSYLSRSTFQSKRDPSADPGSQICSGKDRIGIFSATTNEWIELDLNGMLIGRWSSPLLSGVQNRGDAIAPDGTVYAILSNRKQTQLFTLDKNYSTWKPVLASDDQAQKKSQPMFFLHGIDDDKLVIATPDMSTAAWVAPPVPGASR